MKTDVKKLLAEKAIAAIKTECSDLKDIRKALSCAYNIISSEIKKPKE